MKKVIANVLLGSCLLSTQLIAIEEGNYIGLDIGNTKAEFTAKAGAISASEDDDGTSVTLKLGHQYKDGERVAISIQNIYAEDADVLIGAFSYDYLFGKNDLKPFVGGVLGYGKYSEDSYNIDISGLVYGIQAGLNYQIRDSFSLEIGYRFLKSNMKDTITVSGTNIELEMDDIRNFYFGFNYNY